MPAFYNKQHIYVIYQYFNVHAKQPELGIKNKPYLKNVMVVT